MAEHSPSLALRRAGPEDSRRLWQWANDPITRFYSFRSEPIPWEEHAAWYARRLASPDTRFWLLEADGEPVGQIRYDRQPDGSAEISLSVAPEHRGRGYSREIVARTRELAAAELGARLIVARVLAENAPSRRLFEGAGFTEAGRALVLGRDCFRYTWRPPAAAPGEERA